MSTPLIGQISTIELKIPILSNVDYGEFVQKFEFKGMINNGYFIKCTMLDAQFNILKSLIKTGYLQNSRSRSLEVEFTIKSSPNDAVFPRKSTLVQKAIISKVISRGASDAGILELHGIDPASWYLNAGDASGKAYVGNISNVIKQVISEYAPGISCQVSGTKDSKNNIWYMMRQDPMTFISSLLEWSSSITDKGTNWLVSVDWNSIIISEQAKITPKSRAYYKFMHGSTDTIRKWEMVTNNALSLTETKLVTYGCSVISGKYIDRNSDQKENTVFVKDATTPNKITARSDATNSFTKPDDSAGRKNLETGWTAIKSIPEIYSAGDLGVPYDKYIDGKARSTFLNLLPNLFKVKITVPGHGEWSNTIGLGVDAVYIKWTSEPDIDGNDYFLNGHWIAYGFHHRYNIGTWETDIFLARHDYDSNSIKSAFDITAPTNLVQPSN